MQQAAQPQSNRNAGSLARPIDRNNDRPERVPQRQFQWQPVERADPAQAAWLEQERIRAEREQAIERERQQREFDERRAGAMGLAGISTTDPADEQVNERSPISDLFSPPPAGSEADRAGKQWAADRVMDEAVEMGVDALNRSAEAASQARPDQLPIVATAAAARGANAGMVGADVVEKGAQAFSVGKAAGALDNLLKAEGQYMNAAMDGRYPARLEDKANARANDLIRSGRVVNAAGVNDKGTDGWLAAQEFRERKPQEPMDFFGPITAPPTEADLARARAQMKEWREKAEAK